MKKVFTTKPFEGFLYKWSPDDNVIKKNKPKTNEAEVFCTAVPFSMGEDYVSTYCYRNKIVDGKIKKLAYFTCGYIK